MKTKNIIIAIAALATGAAAGWFAGGLGLTGNGLPAEALAKAGERVTGNGERESGASVAAKPKRKAPIRSSADAEVQKRILKANIAALEKSLSAAKKEAAAIAEAKATKDSTGNLGENAHPPSSSQCNTRCVTLC